MKQMKMRASEEDTISREMIDKMVLENSESDSDFD